MEEPAFSGCLVPSRLIGVIEAMQIKERKRMRNDRVIAIAEKAEVFCEVKSLADLNSKFLEQIEHFFISYNEIEGKKFKPVRRSGPAAAIRLIKQGQRECAARAKESQNS
jgi:inorganic pyrophosphatase